MRVKETIEDNIIMVLCEGLAVFRGHSMYTHTYTHTHTHVHTHTHTQTYMQRMHAHTHARTHTHTHTPDVSTGISLSWRILSGGP